ncbi:unnamed protein product [Didymodactylos carnosus]|uniref:Uncharacterized protein n=1 Tax=Didymodactylos carnosus TaxID=1234261 RepID=A0A813PFW3_9BILA|nr:unnamed protein product [Didymodactylos carnosus]CAF0754500.1 unnamed protein product [Didymodactylos carnosus]CAF3519698.1 unnamed protein product [Didymodactylos carnosus]CAF3534676.1 unnamed protein product [Didymodactylos carnosus]
MDVNVQERALMIFLSYEKLRRPSVSVRQRRTENPLRERLLVRKFITQLEQYYYYQQQQQQYYNTNICDTQNNNNNSLQYLPLYNITYNTISDNNSTDKMTLESERMDVDTGEDGEEDEEYKEQENCSITMSDVDANNNTIINNHNEEVVKHYSYVQLVKSNEQNQFYHDQTTQSIQTAIINQSSEV